MPVYMNLNLLTDQELVRAILDGHRHYFKELIFRYEKKIFRMAYRFCFQKETAEDWTQEIFMRVFQKLSYYDPQYPFCSWILTVSTHYLINERKKKRLPAILIENEQLSQHTHPVSEEEESYKIPQFEEKLQHELERLPQKYQDVFRLYHLEKRSYQDISALLGKPINTIKTHLFRARTELRLRLKKYLE